MIIGEITSTNMIWTCIICVSILSFITLALFVKLLSKFDEFKISMLEYIKLNGDERINVVNRIDKLERKVTRNYGESRKNKA